MTTGRHGNWWDREIIRAFNEGREVPARIGLPPMPWEEIPRLMFTADTKAAAQAQALQEARYRGRASGFAIGRVLLQVREEVAQATEQTLRESERNERISKKTLRLLVDRGIIGPEPA